MCVCVCVCVCVCEGFLCSESMSHILGGCPHSGHLPVVFVRLLWGIPRAEEIRVA